MYEVRFSVVVKSLRYVAYLCAFVWFAVVFQSEYKWSADHVSFVSYFIYINFPPYVAFRQTVNLFLFN